MNKDRNPHILWKVVNKLLSGGVKIKVELIGAIDDSVKRSIIENDLKSIVNHVPYLKHGDALHKAKSASVLLLCVNDTPNLMGVIPGKLFEYFALKRPILNIGPTEGNAAQLINEVGCRKNI